jgi:hypothetical protein
MISVLISSLVNEKEFEGGSDFYLWLSLQTEAPISELYTFLHIFSKTEITKSA